MKKTELANLIGQQLQVWLLMLVFPSFLLAGCGEDNNPDSLRCRVRAVTGPDDDVVGKWKLVRVRDFNFSSGFVTTDHSCDNIVYHFRTDGIVEVNSDGKDVGHPTGNYDYEFVPDPYNPEVAPLALKLDFLEWPFSIEVNRMTWSRVPTDGPEYLFYRIE